ncbi:DUF2726 domain-containing protein [Methylophilus methylotrophus]|uniref:DUF2726 domain-containing protein n=1 Tax=Methylophilus methylotrophus TaxID=17 RepID=UPI000362F53D|nr:DUF2726 domain-containing protein [Methylophilus methylotrophus]
MSFFIVFAIVLIVFILLLKLKKKDQPLEDQQLNDNDQVWPYYVKKPLSQPEQILYFRLIEALPDKIVLAQVQLSRFLGVKKGFDYQSWINRVNRMSADFVICNKDSSVLAVIELDDSTHESSSRQLQDQKKNQVLASANIKLIRWHVKSIPDVENIKTELITPPIKPENEVWAAER